MKIAVLNAEPYPVPPALGGPIARTIYETALAFPPDRMCVVSAWSDRLDDWPYDPARFRHVKHTPSDDAAPWDAETGLDATAAAYLKAAADALASFGPDLIQVHNAPEYLPWLRQRFPHTKLVLFAHNPLARDEAGLDAIGGRADGLVFVSDALRRRFASDHPDAVVRTAVVHNAVDTDLFSPDRRHEPATARVADVYGSPTGPTLLFAGRPLEQKGIGHLIDAMPRVRRAMPGVRLVVAGSAGYGADFEPADAWFAALRRRAKRLGDAVRFVGYVDHERMPAFYAAADLTVVPSLWEEPFGKVVAESMATATPVLASDRGGIPEIVTDGLDGVLIGGPDDPRRLADAVIDLLSDTTRLEAMAEAGRRTAATRFSIPARVAALRSFYAEAADWPAPVPTQPLARPLGLAGRLLASLPTAASVPAVNHAGPTTRNRWQVRPHRDPGPAGAA